MSALAARVFGDSMEAIQQILTALYVALGEAAGGPKAMRTANQVLRDAIADNAVDDPAAIRFLQSLAHEDDTPEVQITRPDYAWWDEINTLDAKAHQRWP
jgi:hypothetical protein